MPSAGIRGVVSKGVGKVAHAIGGTKLSGAVRRGGRAIEKGLGKVLGTGEHTRFAKGQLGERRLMRSLKMDTPTGVTKNIKKASGGPLKVRPEMHSEVNVRNTRYARSDARAMGARHVAIGAGGIAVGAGAAKLHSATKKKGK